MTRDNKGHFIMIKRLSHQENIIIMNVYKPKKFQNTQCKLVEQQIDKFTIIVGELDTTHWVTDRRSRQKIGISTKNLKTTITQLDWVDNWFTPKHNAEYSSSTFTKEDNIMDHNKV
jgi:hypothetical protein